MVQYITSEKPMQMQMSITCRIPSEPVAGRANGPPGRGWLPGRVEGHTCWPLAPRTVCSSSGSSTWMVSFGGDPYNSIWIYLMVIVEFLRGQVRGSFVQDVGFLVPIEHIQAYGGLRRDRRLSNTHNIHARKDPTTLSLHGNGFVLKCQLWQICPVTLDSERTCLEIRAQTKLVSLIKACGNKSPKLKLWSSPLEVPQRCLQVLQFRRGAQMLDPNNLHWQFFRPPRQLQSPTSDMASDPRPSPRLGQRMAPTLFLPKNPATARDHVRWPGSDSSEDLSAQPLPGRLAAAVRRDPPGGGDRDNVR